MIIVDHGHKASKNLLAAASSGKGYRSEHDDMRRSYTITRAKVKCTSGCQSNKQDSMDCYGPLSVAIDTKLDTHHRKVYNTTVFIIPWQSTPSPTNPSLHVHSKEPGTSTQKAFALQGPTRCTKSQKSVVHRHKVHIKTYSSLKVYRCWC